MITGVGPATVPAGKWRAQWPALLLSSDLCTLKSDRLDHPFEGEKGERKDAGGNQGDGGVLQRPGYPGDKNAFAHAGEQN